jgi:hypothetical protein
MGSAGNIPATVKGKRYNCGARGPHEPDFRSQGRCRRHPVCPVLSPAWIFNPLNVGAIAGHLPSAFPSGSPQTTQRGKPGSRTWQIPLCRFTSSENASHMARKVKTCSICCTPTPLRFREQFGSSVSLVQMRSPAYAISLPMTRRNTALNGQTS